MHKYLNDVIEFEFRGRKYYALVIDVKHDGSVICYRVVKKEKLLKKYIPIVNADGSDTGYQIQCNCRFKLPQCHGVKKKLSCPLDLVEASNQKFSEYPTLCELKEKQKSMLIQMKQSSSNEMKKIRNQYNEITRQINEMTGSFLLGTGENESNKYRNYKTLPNRKGISSIYQGGKCSPR